MADIWPVYAGGSQDESVNCFAFDQRNQVVIVGGNTSSPDFAPAASDHGYLVGLDLDGNWLWGNFFYNVSYAVSAISGCQMSSDSNYLAVLGMGNSQPVVMTINTTTG